MHEHSALTRRYWYTRWAIERQITRWYNPNRTGPLATAISWGTKVQHWGPRDWAYLWQTLHATPFLLRPIFWLYTIGRIWQARRGPVDWDGL